MLKLFVLIFLIPTSFASDLDFYRLKKTSMHLTGKMPTPEDYQELKNALAQNRGQSFFDQKINYL